MKVTETIQIDNEHSIEIGTASWDDTILSIRRRKNNENGIYDPFSSSEIAINGHVDLINLICVCINKGLISDSNMRILLKTINSTPNYKAK